jgi:hypothetical protein
VLAAPTTWRSPEELVKLGFERSRVVMMNEAHNGLLRSVRCRRVGQQVLSTAHLAGVRHLAMEALGREFAARANERRAVPEHSGYLGQPEMRDLIQAALELGWTLVPYEADFDLMPHEFANLSMEETNWREEQQARNLIAALERLDDGAKLFVWCGNSHLSRYGGDEWQPMGLRFAEEAGFAAFAIDQSQGIGAGSLARLLVEEFRDEVTRRGGNAGFLAEDSQSTWFGVDAVLLSIDNELT